MTSISENNHSLDVSKSSLRDVSPTARQKRKVLVTASPSPRKRRRIEPVLSAPQPITLPKSPELPILPTLRASNVLQSIAQDTSTRYSSTSPSRLNSKPIVRDPETLTLIENLQLGPHEHKPPLGDPNFQSLEPHSGIRLATRTTSHEDLSDCLRGRYYISPSVLYSVAQLSASRDSYTVPVECEWLTIAVIAEKEAPRSKPNNRNPDKLTSFRKFKLIDLASGSKQVKGDSMLNMLIFASESSSAVKDESSGNTVRVHKGGSGGLYENTSKLTPGTVIAVLNPRILRPFKAGDSKPHPTQNLLAIAPSDLASLVILGTSLDIGFCTSRKKDNSSCGGWFDKRSAPVCEYHLQNAVHKARAARPEFAIATSDLLIQRQQAKQSGHDPANRKGLLPSSGAPVAIRGPERGSDSSIAYMMDGQMLSGGDEYVHEKLGREREERKKRAIKEKEVERALARENTLLKAGPAANQSSSNRAKSAFSATALQRIGFDPTAKSKVGRAKADLETSRKLAVLAALSSADGKRVPKLVSRPKIKASPVVCDDDDSDLEIVD